MKFVKMHGAGNDFVVLDGLADAGLQNADHPALALRLCEPHFGVGADGLMLLTAPSEGEAAVRMRMWNPDGSEDMCGNGLRCIALLAHRLKYTTTPSFVVQTLAGLRRVEVTGSGDVRVQMGLPQFEPAGIPLRLPEGYSDPLQFDLEVGGTVLRQIGSLSTGSTHTVIFSDEPVPDAVFQALSPLLEQHPCFPTRTSVMWTQIPAPNQLQLRIWERGVGETLACGTGACAAAVVAMRRGLCQGEVAVASRGGVLRVSYTPGDGIMMSGPATVVYRGELRLN